jgi:hypothetical protein
MARKKAKKPLDDDTGEPVEQEQPRRQVGNEGLITPPTKEQVEAIGVDITVELATLGESQAAVAAALAKAEIYGERIDDNKCPVANYLKKMVNFPQHTYVSVQHKEVHLLEHFGGDTLLSVPLPKGVMKFIEAWDNGSYKKLADVME